MVIQNAHRSYLPSSNIVAHKGMDVQITGGWWESFCKRHPNLTLRAPAPLATARAQSTDPEVVNRFFDMLEEVFTTFDLQNKPCQVFNMDESGLPLDRKPQWAACPRGMKNPVAPFAGDKSQLMVFARVSAGGTAMPSMVILKLYHWRGTRDSVWIVDTWLNR